LYGTPKKISKLLPRFPGTSGLYVKVTFRVTELLYNPSVVVIAALIAPSIAAAFAFPVTELSKVGVITKSPANALGAKFSDLAAATKVSAAIPARTFRGMSAIIFLRR
jgi:hypothetical protein